MIADYVTAKFLNVPYESLLTDYLNNVQSIYHSRFRFTPFVNVSALDR